MKLDHSSTPYTKINSRWIKDLDIRLKVPEPLEKNLCGTLFNIGLSNIFLDMSSEVTETKAKINKNYIKLKNCTAKETISKTKKQPTEWEKIFANHICNKGLISKIYIKKLMQGIPGDPVVRTPHFPCWGPGFDPGLGNPRSHRLDSAVKENK